MKSTILLLLLALSLNIFAQSPGRTITPTRQVAQFSELENQWMDAIQHKDQSVLDHLLTDDFEILTPLAGNPVARDEFIEAVTGNLKLESYRISQMTVHDFGDTVVVNFLMNAKGQFRGRDSSGQYFFVDVWRRNGNTWQPAVRYLSKSGAGSVTQPRPSGKQ
jgi:ketosteroid isomerase-like protein